MTEDLIAMAKLAGFDVDEVGVLSGRSEFDPRISAGEYPVGEDLKKFAALIEARAVARTREECAIVCFDVGLAAAKDWKARYDPHDQGREFGADECESAIRALGERT